MIAAANGLLKAVSTAGTRPSARPNCLPKFTEIDLARLEGSYT
jgi:hypothetical protein